MSKETMKKRHIRDIAEAQRAIEALISGDLEQVYTPKSKELTPLFSTIDQMRLKMRALQNDITDINKKVFEGNMTDRIDMNQHNGTFGSLANAFNYNVDLIACVLSEFSKNLDRAAGGDFSTRVTTQYHGEFNKLKSSFNTMMHTLHDLAVDARLATTAMKGGVI